MTMPKLFHVAFRCMILVIAGRVLDWALLSDTPIAGAGEAMGMLAAGILLVLNYPPQCVRSQFRRVTSGCLVILASAGMPGSLRMSLQVLPEESLVYGVAGWAWAWPLLMLTIYVGWGRCADTRLRFINIGCLVFLVLHALAIAVLARQTISLLGLAF